MKKSIGIHERLYPNPVVLVSSSFDGIDNIITLAWAGTVCGGPKMISVSIRPSRFSHQLISGSREFVINIPTKSQVDICKYCGKNSGRNVNKFKKLNLTKHIPSVINTPLIKECPINIECRVKDIIKLGVHDLFIGEVVYVNSDEEIIYEDGDIDYEKLDTISYCMGKYFKNVLI
ncbi:MAG: flavin reductase family protein [Actinobacteria bacterium]|nr:flavin reductase family protein [Actinomycetota bacterium]